MIKISKKWKGKSSIKTYAMLLLFLCNIACKNGNIFDRNESRARPTEDPTPLPGYNFTLSCKRTVDDIDRVEQGCDIVDSTTYRRYEDEYVDRNIVLNTTDRGEYEGKIDILSSNSFHYKIILYDYLRKESIGSIVIGSSNISTGIDQKTAIKQAEENRVLQETAGFPLPPTQ